MLPEEAHVFATDKDEFFYINYVNFEENGVEIKWL